MELVTCDHYVKMKKMDFRITLIQIYFEKQKHDPFIREINQCLAEVIKELENYPPNLVAYEQHWPSTIKAFLVFVRDNHIIDNLLCPQILSSEGSCNARQALIKLYKYMPREVLSAIVRSRKILLIKYLITSKPLTAECASWLIDLIVCTKFE